VLVIADFTFLRCAVAQNLGLVYISIYLFILLFMCNFAQQCNTKHKYIENKELTVLRKCCSVAQKRNSCRQSHGVIKCWGNPSEHRTTFQPQQQGTSSGGLQPCCCGDLGLDMRNKKCTKCEQVKSVEEFHKNGRGGRRSDCKTCVVDARRRYSKNNRDKINEYFRLVRPAKSRARYATDPAYALTLRARAQSVKAFRGAGNVVGFFRHMPYTQEEFVRHLLSTLPVGYTEADACDGNKLHIDHIRPISSFNLTGDVDDEFKACWALENLRLLPARDNMVKGAKYNGAKR